MSLLLLSLAVAAPLQESIAEAEDPLEAAEMAYWAALADFSAPELLRLAESHLVDAIRLGAKDEEASRQRSLSLEGNLDAQRDMGHDTIRAAFPAYRLLLGGLVHEVLVDDPWAVSTVAASEALREALQGGLGRYGQFDLRGRTVYRHAGDMPRASAESRPDLLNEAFYVLRRSQRLWLDPRLQQLERDHDAPHVLLDLELSDAGTAPPLWAVTATATLSIDGQPTGDQVRTFGFALDRRGRVPQLLLLLGAMIAISVAPAVWRRSSSLQVGAALAAFLVGAGVTAALFYVVRDLLPAPDQLVATGLWGPLVLAAVSTYGPLLTLVLVPGKLSAVLPFRMGHWSEREFGAWPAVLGGGTLLLGATLVESGLPRALALGVPWLFAQHHATTWMERGAHRGRGRRALLGAVLGIALLLGALTIPGEHWTPLAFGWLVGAACPILAGVALGVEAVAAAMAPFASLALLSGALAPLAVLGVAPFLLAASARRRVTAGVAGREPAPDGTTLADRLEDAKPGAGRAALPARLREPVEAALAGAGPWRRVLVMGGGEGDRRAMGLAVARLVAGPRKVAVLRQDSEATDPLDPLRRLIPGAESRVRQTVTGVAALVAGVDPAERSAEDDQRALACSLNRWLEEGVGPGALLVDGAPSKELQAVLGRARAAAVAQARSSRPPLWEVSMVGTPPQPGHRGPDLTVLELGRTDAERVKLHTDYLTECVQLDPELVRLFLKTAEEGLSLEELHRLLELLTERGLLDGDRVGPVSPPPVSQQKEFLEQLQTAARECADDSEFDMGSLTEAQRRPLLVAAHLGLEFSVDVVAEVLGQRPADTSRTLSPLTDLLDDPDQDGMLEFSDPRILGQLRRIQRISTGSDCFRWRQAALDDLRDLARVYLDKYEADPEVELAAPLEALRLLRSNLDHGGATSRCRGLLRSAFEALLAQPHLYRRRRRVVVELCQFFLSRHHVPADLEVRLHTAVLRWEHGTTRTQDLPLESAREARAVLESDDHPEAEGDVLRVEIACRLIDAMRPGELGPEEARGLLELVLARGEVSVVVKARALYELARLEWLSVKVAEDTAGRYDNALLHFERAVELAREEGEQDTLRRALRTWADALSSPPKGRTRAPIEQRVALLEEALTINRSMEDVEGEAMVLGTIGRCYLYRVLEDPAPQSEEQETCALQARDFFEADRALAEDALAMHEVVKADTWIAQAEWQLKQWASARDRLESARAMLSRLVGSRQDLDLDFILSGLLAEATRVEDHERAAAIEAELVECGLGSELRARLERFYAPHLTFSDE